MEAAEYCRLFVKGTTNVLQEYGIEIAEIGATIPSPTKYMETRGLDVMVYLTEEAEGVFLLSLPMDTAMNLARKIDLDPDSVDEELTREVVAEMGNLVGARASASLSRLGITTNITPPSIFCGTGSHIFSVVPHLHLTEFSTGIGNFWVYSAIRRREKTVIYV